MSFQYLRAEKIGKKNVPKNHVTQEFIYKLTAA